MCVNASGKLCPLLSKEEQWQWHNYADGICNQAFPEDSARRLDAEGIQPLAVTVTESVSLRCHEALCGASYMRELRQYLRGETHELPPSEVRASPEVAGLIRSVILNGRYEQFIARLNKRGKNMPSIYDYPEADEWLIRAIRTHRIHLTRIVHRLLHGPRILADILPQMDRILALDILRRAIICACSQLRHYRTFQSSTNDLMGLIISSLHAYMPMGMQLEFNQLVIGARSIEQWPTDTKAQKRSRKRKLRQFRENTLDFQRRLLEQENTQALLENFIDLLQGRSNEALLQEAA